MKNVTMKTEGTKLFIEIDLEADGEVSSTGKSLNIATTRGNVEIPGAPGLRIGINMFRSNPDYVEPAKPAAKKAA